MPAPSRRLRRLAAPALAALLALVPAACDLEGSNPNTPRIVESGEVAEEPAPPPGTPPVVEVEPGAGVIGIRGEFVRSCTVGQVGITHTFDGSALTFRATSTPAGSCADAEPTRQFLRYIAYLTHVPPGTYQVRVIHVNDDLAGGTGTVFEQTITVP